MATIRARLPAQARPGETVQVRALIQHPMETGFRRDEAGRAFPRNILKDFTCSYDGAVVFRAEFFPAVAADPFLAFHFVATRSGDVVLSWTEDTGKVFSQTLKIDVT
ncbi:MAG TPA: thiosulfate oxidation carrier complex protein SoxZ [Beijerinckiaceae bacterium]|nr:thiosulfate oxidation carrier complex protein SoxZ [Beijerinckiaceae bacterium]